MTTILTSANNHNIVATYGYYTSSTDDYVLTAGSALSGNLFGFYVALGTVSLTNFGSISGSTIGFFSSDAATLTNAATGIIVGADAVRTFGALTATNYGVLTGSIAANSAPNTIVNYGTIGNYTGGSGSDTITLFTGSTFGSVNGNAGTDTLTLRLDDRVGATTTAGSNSGVTTGTIASVSNVEALSVQSGTWTLTGSQDYSSGIALSGGTLIENGTSTGALTVTGGQLSGSGTVGAVTITSGTLAPGNSPGTLNAGSLNLGAGATFAAEITGTGAGQYDRVNVTGTVTLGGATLSTLVSGYTPVGGDSFTLISNDGVDAVTGTFAGIVEGGTVMLAGQAFYLATMAATATM